jgi:ABC-type uncharacterized transport system substrate-binding protein
VCLLLAALSAKAAEPTKKVYRIGALNGSAAAQTSAKILRSANPADLPVEQPTRVDFVVHLKTANTEGHAIPPSLLLRADEVIR